MKHIRKTLSILLAAISLVIFVTGCGDSKEKESPSPSPESTNSTAQTPSIKNIEITSENWDTYFEFVEKEKEYINDYNEIEHISLTYYFSLKDEFVMNKEGTDIALMYSYHESQYKVEEDLTNKKIIWGELISENEEPVVEETNIRYSPCPIAGEVFMTNGNFKSQCSDFQVIKIYGTLSILE